MVSYWQSYGLEYLFKIYKFPLDVPSKWARSLNLWNFYCRCCWFHCYQCLWYNVWHSRHKSLSFAVNLDDKFASILAMLSYCHSSIPFYWKVFKSLASCFCLSGLKPLIPKSDKHLISTYNITPEWRIKVTRVEQIITKQRSSWLLTNSPCQYPRTCMGNCMKNIHTDVAV